MASLNNHTQIQVRPADGRALVEKATRVCEVILAILAPDTSGLLFIRARLVDFLDEFVSKESGQISR